MQQLMAIYQNNYNTNNILATSIGQIRAKYRLGIKTFLKSIVVRKSMIATAERRAGGMKFEILVQGK